MNKEITLLLPTTGEPLLLYCWFENYKKYQHLISNIFVAVDTMGKLNPMEFIFIQNYLKRQFSKIPNLRYHFNHALGQHGLNIDTLLSNYEPDIKENVLLMEEDDLILNADVLESEINQYFEKEYDIIGVGRGSCTPYLSQLIGNYIRNRKDLHIDTLMSDDENYYNFWPTLFLTKKKNFLNSSRIFYSYSWSKNSILKLGNQEHFLTEDCNGDTFVKYSMELYQNLEVKKIKLLNNTYHSRIEDDRTIPSILDTSIDFHIGSLSGVLVNKFWNPLQNKSHEHSFIEYVRLIKDTEYGYHEIVDIYRRCCLLKHMLTSIKNPADFEFYQTYEKNITSMLNTFEKENDIKDLLSKIGIQASMNVDCHKNVFAKIYE